MSCLSVCGPSSEKKAMRQMISLQRSGQPGAAKVLCYKRDGTPFWSALLLPVLFYELHVRCHAFLIDASSTEADAAAAAKQRSNTCELLAALQCSVLRRAVAYNFPWLSNASSKTADAAATVKQSTSMAAAISRA